jgi:diadenylate cyclase
VTETIYEWIVDLWRTLSGNFHIVDLIDVVLVACAVYWVLILLRGTRAAQMMLGLLILVFAWLLSGQLQLATLGFILDNFLQGLFLIVIVIFQADIRRALVRVGRGFFATVQRQEAHAVEEIVRASQALSQRRVGALIVIERDVSLEEYMELGTAIDAELTRDLLVALFLPYSPLHDGAVVIRRSRVAAAGCIMPIALQGHLDAALGTRHRAALGVADETDAVAIVVSEETGRISLVVGGELGEHLGAANLRQELLRLTRQGRERAPRRDDGSMERSQLPESETGPAQAEQPTGGAT